MRNFLHAATLLFLDMASTILFLIVFSLTHNVRLAVGLGMALGLAQIGIQFARRKPIATMEWLSLFLVIASGTATLLTNDPRFVQFKPSAIYVIVGLVMLKPGWMNRYLPPIAQAVMPDVATVVGFLWAGLMFASAATNAVVAIKFSLATWAWFMPMYGMVSKVTLFLGGFVAMRFIGRRRVLAMPEAERDALLAGVGIPSGNAYGRTA
jgi:intracellular septation protein